MSDKNRLKPARPKALTCSCCGQRTLGRQWWNRDQGFGLCTPCIPFATSHMTEEEIRLSYGIRGVHYDCEGNA